MRVTFQGRVMEFPDTPGYPPRVRIPPRDGLGGSLWRGLCGVVNEATEQLVTGLLALTEIDAVYALVSGNAIVEDLHEFVAEFLVVEARARGESWSEIAAALGLKSRQAAEQRYGKMVREALERREKEASDADGS